jgi:hypothetical protein
MNRPYCSFAEEVTRKALAFLKANAKRMVQIEQSLRITKGPLLKQRDRYQVKLVNSDHRLVSSDLAIGQLISQPNAIRYLQLHPQPLGQNSGLYI